MQNQQEIAKIAYELYLTRGGAPGDPVADWVTAERIYAEKMAQHEASFVVNKNEAPATKPRARKVVAKESSTKQTKQVEAKAIPAKADKKAAEVAKPKRVSSKKTNGAAPN